MSDLKPLHAKIGQLTLENDFLESALNGILPDGSVPAKELTLMRLVDECICTSICKQQEAYPVGAVYHR